MIQSIVILLLVLSLTFYLIFYVIYPSVSNKDVLPSMTSLDKKTDIVMPDVAKSTLLGNSSSTLMGFIKLTTGDRTGIYSGNGLQFTPIVFSNHNWYLETISNPKDKDHSSARLRVTTKNRSASSHDEFIELPPIPKQKWVFIAILREGRRFDIIYDNRIVASKRLENYPAMEATTISIGSKGLSGSAIHFMINGTRLHPTEVERERLAHVDSTNSVVEDNPIMVTLPSLPSINIFSQCPPGLPCDPITNPPKNSFYKWESPYA
jgi:hypothetical protein